MALPAIMLDYVCRAAQELGGGSACSAGYPDLLVTKSQLEALLGPERAARVSTRPDSADILGWHGMRKAFDAVYDARETFAQIGFSLDVVDLTAARGDEILVDLNLPLPADFLRRYDLVLDTGTCEHCFHIGQAAANLAQLVRKGGYIIQALPLNSFNHGFYNVNPTWFHDFYPANGFNIHLLVGISSIVLDPKFTELPPYAGFGQLPEKTVAVVVAQRMEDSPLVVPVQRKYVQNPNLKRGST
ncbi:MAG: hypothetical protein H7Y16_02935 [Candidatus Parcubacteria bacterium]|nr:hypothetical protein [Burkholderiales bacterium]